MHPDQPRHIADHARRYLSWGITPIPLDGEKVPVAKWKPFQRRTPTDADITRLFLDDPAEWQSRHPDRNRPVCGIAALHGPPSAGLSCRDFDVASDYHVWAEANPALASSLPTVATVRGFHVWFRCEVESFEKLPNGEYRGRRTTYSVLPPSVRTDADGFAYQWVRNAPTGLDSFPVIDPVAAGLRSPLSQRDHDWIEKVNAKRKRQAPPQPASWVVDFTTPNPTSVASSSIRQILNDTKVTIPTVKEERSGEELVRSGNNDETEAIALPVLGRRVEAAVRKATPTGTGRRDGCIWLLARSLRTLDSDRTADEWSEAFALWWSLARHVVGTQDRETSWADFRRAYGKARPFTFGDDPVSKARRAAGEVDGTDAKVLAVCCELEHGTEDGVFMLASTLLADLTGLSQPTAWRVLGRFVRDEVLVVVEASRRGNMGVGHRYRFQ